MKVRNRDGEYKDVSYDEIKARIARLCSEEELRVLDIDKVVIQTIQGIYDGITTWELDDLSARVCVSCQSLHHGYDSLAGKIIMSNLHKTVRRLVCGPDGTGCKASGSGGYATFSERMAWLARKQPSTYAPDVVAFVARHADALDAMVDYARDFQYNFFSVRTMERAYLLKVDNTCVESPQDMWMRVAVGVHCPRGAAAAEADAAACAGALQRIRETYDYMSQGYFTHATPTLFNAGTRYEQNSSCYLAGLDDSLSDIYRTLANCAQISKWAGGIGLHVSNIRAKGSRINTTQGTSDGIVPMLKVFNETARYCNQSGRRKGSIAIYLEPWHADVWEFVELRRNTGAETERARDLFLALWVPDAFMRRLLADEDWYLMSPDACPGLTDAVGDEFEALYSRYVAEKKYVRKMKAKTLWQHILQCQLETGTPYVCFKDHVNRKNNQSNLGTIKSSNLCAEIVQYSDEGWYAVCNLASIAVNRFLGDDGKTYHFDQLHAAAKCVAHNLNRIIDINYYPTPETRLSNENTRLIGIGIQGVADLLCAMKLPYDSEEALDLDAAIMETIYHGALEASIELARRDGPYARFEGSPFSRGQLQMDMWESEGRRVRYSGRWDWEAVRRDLVQHGARNSMLTALMPTASTFQLLGNAECFEPFHSNVFKRTTIAGEFMVVNKQLMKDMMARGLWNDSMRQLLVQQDGSVQSLSEVPEDLKRIYKSVWELPQRSLIDHAAARAPFVDQSQSMNLFFARPNFGKLNSALIYAWNAGLKTGLYYLRSKPASEAIKYGVAGGAGAPAAAASPSPPSSGTTPTKAAGSGQQQQQPQSPSAAAGAAVQYSGPVCDRSNPHCEMCSA